MVKKKLELTSENAGQVNRADGMQKFSPPETTRSLFCQTSLSTPISTAIRMHGGTVISRQHIDKKTEAWSN